jgi:hypothetical protein
MIQTEDWRFACAVVNRLTSEDSALDHQPRAPWRILIHIDKRYPHLSDHTEDQQRKIYQHFDNIASDKLGISHLSKHKWVNSNLEPLRAQGERCIEWANGEAAATDKNLSEEQPSATKTEGN